jgi:prepilin-type processing-associated H-X9-DG protein
LLPALNAARRQADRTKCLSALRQLGQAFNMYAADNQGMWPASRWQYRSPTGANLEKRWFDYVSKYVLSKARELNPNGDTMNDIGLPQIRDGSNVLWGCPSWRRWTQVGASGSEAPIHPGYNMNFFTFAPNDLKASGNYAVDRSKLAYRNLDGSVNPTTAAAIKGYPFKASQWRNAGERCLLFDSVHPVWVVSFTTAKDWATKWPFVPETSVPFPVMPDGADWTLDFNRHGRKKLGNKPDEASMNILYCDGHAGFVSCREAFRAIRFR